MDMAYEGEGKQLGRGRVAFGIDAKQFSYTLKQTLQTKECKYPINTMLIADKCLRGALDRRSAANLILR